MIRRVGGRRLPHEFGICASRNSGGEAARTRVGLIQDTAWRGREDAADAGWAADTGYRIQDGGL